MTIPNRGERSVAADAGGAKPIAGRGGLEGFTPPHRFKARTQASDGHCASTRAARQRRAQICGEITVQSDGRWAGSPRLIMSAPGEGSESPDCAPDHLIHRKRSPFPYEGKDLTPDKV